MQNDYLSQLFAAIDNNEFELYSSEESLKKAGISIHDWRRLFVYSKVGSLHTCGGGRLIIRFPDGTTQKSRTKNLARRLDEIIKQLMQPRNRVITDTWIKKYRAQNGPLTMEDIKKLRIIVEHDGGAEF